MDSVFNIRERYKDWGKQGATFVELKKVRKGMFKDALKTAYQGVASSTKNRKK